MRCVSCKLPKMTVERRLGSTGFNGSKAKHHLKAHVIDDISYSEDYIVCSCAWRGKTTEFPAHRKELGLPRRR
jgi:hypothetical protein